MSNDLHYCKTRIAPTPSGYLHPGNILSFALTSAIATAQGAKVLLRIDDLDQQRADKKYVEDIFETLNYLDIPWDEGPSTIQEFYSGYSQLHRISLYNGALTYLVENKLVFACDCSRKQLRENNATTGCSCLNRDISLNAENVCWRLIAPAGQLVHVKNIHGDIVAAALPAELENFVVRKKDGYPSYQLTSVIDDLHYEVDLIIRGDDLWPSTLAQHVLALALKRTLFNNIGFYHHPLILDANGAKLSKSAGAASVKYLRDNKNDAAAIYTAIAAMLGYNKPVANWQSLAKLIYLNN